MLMKNEFLMPSALKPNNIFKVNRQVLLPNIQSGDLFKIIEIHDWKTLTTYIAQRCDEDGVIQPISRTIEFWAKDIDRLISLGHLTVYRVG
jgi:hypothetical protein